jgi:formylglycine-generating enzyme required for sulfatase activity
MKKYILTLLIAVAVLTSAQAQTLQIDPIYVGGTATFEVQNGSPAALAILGYSLVGSGPYSLSNGLVLDLSMPIKTLNPIILDSLGNGSLGPLPVPSTAFAGLQIWFQAVHVDPQTNPSLTTTNMVPITLQIMPPPPAVDMVAIPGGTFEMGDHAGVGGSKEQPVHSVTLDAFYMDKYEVSNTKFADFLNNSTVTVSYGSYVYQVGGAGQLICYLSYALNHNGSTFGLDAGKDNHPVVFQTWYGAALYCNYLSTANGRTPCYDETTFDCDFTADGFRLPTEAEWEYASRGGEHNPYYQYPWGSDSITSADANYDFDIGTTVDVGSYAANGYGLYDMAGNVWEWCNDWYDGSYYSNSPATNPTGPASGLYRVIRGGSWYYSAFYLRCANRNFIFPTRSDYSIGFRVLAVQ